jgi:hypothetical protein
MRVEEGFYHRRFDRDLPEKRESYGMRGAAIALPFLSLYRPFAAPLSLALGATRAITSGAATTTATSWSARGGAMAQTALSVCAVVATVGNFSIGLLITTGADILTSLAHAASNFYSGRTEKGGEEFLQAVASSCYLALLVSFSLEMVLISILLQAALSFHQARQEFTNGRYPEAFAKLAMGLIRVAQARAVSSLIQQRKALQAIAAVLSSPPIDPPLTNLQEAIAKKRAVIGGRDFGAHFHGYGGKIVEGANLSFRTRVITGKEYTELEFRVNRAFRNQIEQGLRSSKAGQVTLKPFYVGKSPAGNAYVLDVPNLGLVELGASSNLPTLYDRVIVKMEPTKSYTDLQSLLSHAGLSEALTRSTPDDILRLKMGQLFQTFAPKQAYDFQQSQSFFLMPPEQLKHEIVARVPNMKESFDTYLDKMEARDLFPGYTQYAITGLAAHIHRMGARMLTVGVSGPQFERAAEMLKSGLLSTESRHKNGMPIGISFSNATSFSVTHPDVLAGGSSSVFTQMITERDMRENISLPNFSVYHRQVRLLISLEALETGSYHYRFGGYTGLRPGGTGWNRISTNPHGTPLLEFVQQLQTAPRYTPPHNHPAFGFDQGHELMLKDRIDPSMVRGLVVGNATDKATMIAELQKHHLLASNNTINGTPVDRFIQIATHIGQIKG